MIKHTCPYCDKDNYSADTVSKSLDLRALWEGYICDGGESGWETQGLSGLKNLGIQ